MQAALQERYGPPEVVRVADVERPVPKDDEVLVRVEAASVNRADLDGLGPRPGFVRLFLGHARAAEPSDGHRCRRRRRVGRRRTAPGSEPGDEVFADLFPSRRGAFAEYACAPEKAFQPIPAGMSFEDAATLPHSAILALQGLGSATAGRSSPATRS